MGLRSQQYRPAHTAHGPVYLALFMGPLALWRALLGSARRRPSRRGPPQDVAAPSQRRRLASVPPPPPPPAEVSFVRLWAAHEGRVRPQWEAEDATAARRVLPLPRRRVRRSTRRHGATL
ncbi:MAG: hypothetical protein ABR529_03745 [Actinomycetota bacterium]